MTKTRGRNERCWCGSGDKYKRCCIETDKLGLTAGFREICSFGGIPFAQYVAALPPEQRQVAEQIRKEKRDGKRTRPSDKLTVRGAALTDDFPGPLLDRVAELVDENIFGRSDMCIQFAALLARALRELALPAVARKGTATYSSLASPEPWVWLHAWVVYDDVIVDGNCDSMAENVMVPDGIAPRAYWGPISEIPGDRSFELDSSQELELHEAEDEDVAMWWQELRPWLRHE